MAQTFAWGSRVMWMMREISGPTLDQTVRTGPESIPEDSDDDDDDDDDDDGIDDGIDDDDDDGIDDDDDDDVPVF